MIEPYGIPSVQETVARYLARTRGPATLAVLAQVAEPMHQISAEDLQDALHAHPAFLVTDGTYRIGRASSPMIPSMHPPRGEIM